MFLEEEKDCSRYVRHWAHCSTPKLMCKCPFHCLWPCPYFAAVFLSDTLQRELLPTAYHCSTRNFFVGPVFWNMGFKTETKAEKVVPIISIIPIVPIILYFFQILFKGNCCQQHITVQPENFSSGQCSGIWGSWRRPRPKRSYQFYPLYPLYQLYIY